MDSVIKDTGKIWSRLFDHKPVIQGEISFFLREFQEKRNDREVDNLFKILEYSTELGQGTLDRAEELGDLYLPTLKANLDVAVSMCECVINKSGKVTKSTYLSEQRVNRVAEWEKFINDMSDKCAKVDQEFKDKETELEEYYTKLEEKLHIQS